MVQNALNLGFGLPGMAIVHLTYVEEFDVGNMLRAWFNGDAGSCIPFSARCLRAACRPSSRASALRAVWGSGPSCLLWSVEAERFRILPL